MSSVIISEKNRAKICKILAAAEGKSTVRLLSYDDIAHLADRAEKRLCYLPACRRVGARVPVAGERYSFPAAYEYCPHATRVSLVRRPGGWAIESAWRGDARERCGALTVTPEQGQEILATYLGAA